MQELEYTESSGNVFADIGVAHPEEALAKARLAAEISAIITERGLSQVQAAQLLGLRQPKVSAIVRGDLRGFSLERLIRCLTTLHRDVEIVVSTPRPARTAGHVQTVIRSTSA